MKTLKALAAIGISVALMFSVSAFILNAFAQAAQTHSVTLTWVDTGNPATGTTYSVYRATGLCSGTPSFSKIATGVTVKTFTDTTVTPGSFCFQATATFSGVESTPSNTFQANVPAFAPTGLTGTVQ